MAANFQPAETKLSRLTEAIESVNKKSIQIVSVLFLLAVPLLRAQTRPRESLRGLTGIYVYVHPVSKEVEAGGLTTSQIQKAVLAQLREAGIQILNEPQASDGAANLGVIISTVKRSQGEYLFEVEVSLLQEVHLARRQDPDTCPAATWSANALGLTGANRMDIILEPVKARLADFVSDFLAVNPKPHP